MVVLKVFRIAFAACLCIGWATSENTRADLQAGAAAVDVSPVVYPVVVNGGMTSRTVDATTRPIFARAIVLSEADTVVGIVVVDSCMLPREFADDVKQLASVQLGIRPDHILISATHTHSAPSVMAALGTDPDPEYPPLLRNGIVEALRQARGNRRPAVVGWGIRQAPEFTALRRWIRRPDRVEEDPFGNPTVRANMHAAANPDDVVGESGPEDPALSVLCLRTPSGEPIAALANFSMHYFSGERGISSDYFGIFCRELEQRVSSAQTAGDDGPEFVALMSHGCSGDIWRRDYARPKDEWDPFETVESYAEQLSGLAFEAWQDAEWGAPEGSMLAMAEERLPLRYRVPDAQRLEWARRVVAEMGDRLPKTRPEVYAREQLALHELQSTEVVVQGLRIGSCGIATTPNETYALTGLKVKHASPLLKTMVIELANGGDGYIPPPEQHLLGGYNTWAARSAGLEVNAENVIAEGAVRLLEQVAGAGRREPSESVGPAAAQIRDSEPIAWYRLDEMAGHRAHDFSGNHHDAVIHWPVAYFLEGPAEAGLTQENDVNRCLQIAGGRISARLPVGGADYTVRLWIRNGMPTDARPVTGWFFARGADRRPDGAHLQVGLSGTGGPVAGAGRLMLRYRDGNGDLQTVPGRTELNRWDWYSVRIVSAEGAVSVYLGDDSEPEIHAESVGEDGADSDMFWFGGRNDPADTWEGRIDEIVVNQGAL